MAAQTDVVPIQLEAILADLATQGKSSPASLLSTPTPARPSCPECGGAGFYRVDAPVGDPRFGKPIPCTNPIHSGDRLRRLAGLSNIEEADLARRLSDIRRNAGNARMLDAVRQMIDTPRGWLYVWGGPGNAKTEALIAAVNEINLAGRGPAVYMTLAHLIDWIRAAFRDGAPDDYTTRFRKVLAVRALAIDEMDKARDTDFSDEFRFHFLDERYRQAVRGDTVTLFAGNTDPAVLPEPIYDRVRDGRFKVVKNTAASARPHMRREE